LILTRRTSRDVLVLELAHLVFGRVEDAREGGARLRLAVRAADLRALAELLLGLGAQRLRVGDELPRQLLLEQREGEVLRIELRAAGATRQLLCGCDRLLALDRQSGEVHQCDLLSGGWAGR
jgi:hypothetical protein